MHQRMTAAELKRLSKGQMLGNYSNLIITYLTVVLAVSAMSGIQYFLTDESTPVGIIISLAVGVIVTLLQSVLETGLKKAYLGFICGQAINPGVIFTVFKDRADRIIATNFAIMVLQTLCMLPSAACGVLFLYYGSLPVLAIGGVLAAAGLVFLVYVGLVYSQTGYILVDFPDMTVRETLAASARLMKGNKLRRLALDLSFIPVSVLGILSCGAGFLWLYPYFHTTHANFYLELASGWQTEI